MKPREKTVLLTDYDIVRRGIKDKRWLAERWGKNKEAIELLKELFKKT